MSIRTIIVEHLWPKTYNLPINWQECHFFLNYDKEFSTRVILKEEQTDLKISSNEFSSSNEMRSVRKGTAVA